MSDQNVEISNIFLDCVNFIIKENKVEDDYWKNIFYCCSIAEYPKGVYYDDNKNIMRIFDTNSKSYSYQLTNSPEENIKIIKNAFIDVVGLCSSEKYLECEKKILLEKQKQKINDLKNTEWKNIKSKDIKDFLINDYINTYLKETYNLSLKDIKNFKLFIDQNVKQKNLLPNDFVMVDGELIEIKNIERDDGVFYVCQQT